MYGCLGVLLYRCIGIWRYRYVGVSVYRCIDVSMYRCMGMCKEYGITVISVGHRPTLLKHHVNLLKLNGKGGSTVEKIKHD